MFSNAFQNVVGMSLVLGAVSYGIGLAPLSMPLSRKQLAMLSNLGTGLLIGTALGVILPEGIEQLLADADWGQGRSSFGIGIPVLLGFALMFLLGEYTTPHGQPLAHSSASQPEGLALGVDLEEQGRPPSPESPRPPQHYTEAGGAWRTHPLSFGLIIHALVDGYALGVSASNARSPNLSLVVFLAIIVHKAPTALALTATLLANSLSVTDCKRHLLYFSLAAPVSSVLSYAFHSADRSTWSGGALLFSGGTFLYVASVVQPISEHGSESLVREIGKTVRVVLLVGGMFFPVLVSRLVVHGH